MNLSNSKIYECCLVRSSLIDFSKKSHANYIHVCEIDNNVNFNELLFLYQVALNSFPHILSSGTNKKKLFLLLSKSYVTAVHRLKIFDLFNRSFSIFFRTPFTIRVWQKPAFFMKICFLVLEVLIVKET